MPFTLPNFNLLADYWVFPHLPSTGPPDVFDVPCQVYVNTRSGHDFTPENFFAAEAAAIMIRSPAGSYVPQRGDTLSVNAYPTEYYTILWTQKMHIGFPNEYRATLVLQCNSDGTVVRFPFQ